MKVLHWFIGFFFITSLAFSQSVVEASSSLSPGLQSAIEHVKKMRRSGASKKDIATYVTTTVANRLTFLNHKFYQEDGSVMVDDEIEKKVEQYDDWYNKGVMVDEAFSSATWSWENRMGHCDQAASTAYHILVMAYESADEVTTVRMQNFDHRFVIFGDDVKNIPDSISPDDLRKLDNTYVVDPWDSNSFSTKDLSRIDLYQYGPAQRVSPPIYTHYKQQYGKWLAWSKKYPDKYKKWLKGIPDTAAQRAKDNKEMNRLLAQYQKEINELKALKGQIEKARRDNPTPSFVKVRLKTLLVGLRMLKNYETKLLNHFYQGEFLCADASKLHKKILALSSAMEDGEALVNEKIDLAKDQAANCKTDADSISIRNNYQAALAAYAIMIKAKEGALVSFMDRKKKLEQLKEINNSLKNVHDNRIDETGGHGWKEVKRLLNKVLNKEIPLYLEQLRTNQKNVTELIVKVQELKNKIEASRQNYEPFFIKSTIKFQKLIKEITNDIRLDYVITIDSLDELILEHKNIQAAVKSDSSGRDYRSNARFFEGAPPVINCLAIEASEKVMAKIDEAFLRGLLVLKTNDDLLGGCLDKPVVQTLPDDSDNTPPDTSPPSPTGGATLGTPATDPATSSNVMRGLVIAGSAEVMVGDGVTFTATDRAGKIYTEGSFEWSVSDSSIVSLGQSGNPVSGVAYKVGTFTLNLATSSGGWVSLDVTIKEKESSIFGTTGGENSETDKGDLFGTFGGETNTDNTSQVTTINCDHIPGSTAVQGQCICTDGLILSRTAGRCISCAKYYQVSKTAIADGALDAAQAIVNEARACTSWTAEVQGLINSARQDQFCNNIAANLRAACQINDVMGVHGFMAEAHQNNCIIDGGLWQWGNTLITEHNQRVEDERTAQQQAQTQMPQQPQNQTNWIDVFNLAIKGVQDVQKQRDDRRDRDKKTASPSFPTSSDIFNQHGDRTWQGANGIIGGNNTQQEAGTWNSSNNTSSGSNSQCGRKMSKAELAPKLAKFKNTVKTQWVPKGLVTWSSLFDTNIYLGRDLNRDRYEANVNIWDQRVNCYNSCVQAAPNKAPNRNLKPFYACIRNCGSNKFHYKSCP